MKAISILLDDARDVAAGKQTLHAKCWPTDYRGPLLLCGARPHLDRHPAETFCVVDLVECRRSRPGDAVAAGRSEESMQMYTYVWRWANPRPVVIVTVRGEWGVYDVDDGLIVLSDGKPVPPSPSTGRLVTPVIATLQHNTGLVDVGQANPSKARAPATDAGQAMLFG